MCLPQQYPWQKNDFCHNNIFICHNDICICYNNICMVVLSFVDILYFCLPCICNCRCLVAVCLIDLHCYNSFFLSICILYFTISVSSVRTVSLINCFRSKSFLLSKCPNLPFVPPELRGRLSKGNTNTQWRELETEFFIS